MIILPTSNAPHGVARARQLLTEVADQRKRCTMIVFRDNGHAREVASRADVRAHGDPFRQVVWIPDLVVLDGVDRFARLARAERDGVDAISLTIRFQPSASLMGPDAIDFMKLELAFIDAERGVVLP